MTMFHPIPIFLPRVRIRQLSLFVPLVSIDTDHGKHCPLLILVLQWLHKARLKCSHKGIFPGILPVTITHTVRHFHLTDINYKNTSFTYFGVY